MAQYLDLANIRILLWLNHGLAQNPFLYWLSLFITDDFANIAVGVTVLMLWFWPDARQDAPLFGEAKLSSQEKTRSKPDLRAGNKKERPIKVRRGHESLSRIESRAQLLVFGIAGLAAYITARFIALEMDVLRPFVTYLPVRAGVEGAFDGLRRFGSFPSDHAALLGALPVALFYWNRWWGWAWTILGVVLVAVRIALGFHYPGDMLVGAGIGCAYAGIALWAYRRQRVVNATANSLAGAFDLSNAPYCYVLYFLVAAVAVVFKLYIAHVVYMVAGFPVDSANRFGS